MRSFNINRNSISNWWWTTDRTTLFLIVVVAVVGMVLLMAASPAVAEKRNLPPFHFVRNQIIFLISGAGLVVWFSMLPVVTVRRIAVIGFAGCVLLMIFVLMSDYQVKGAKRWLPFGGFSLQPSEFIKPFFAVLSGWILARGKMQEKFPSFRIALIVYGLVILLLILQPDIGMTMAVSAIFGGQMFLAGLPIIWILTMIISGAVGLLLAYKFLPHVTNRINLFLDPSSGDNFQVEKSLEAFVNGGFLGKGPGEGSVKTIIPDCHTDFIFAVAGEELGLLACLLIVFLFGFMTVRGFARILRETDLFIIYAASGLLIQFGFQAFVNMGVALNILPNKGMTLPFISYGGSSIWGMSIAMGMLLAFTRRRFGKKSVLTQSLLVKET